MPEKHLTLFGMKAFFFFSVKSLCHKWTKGYMNSNHAYVIHKPYKTENGETLTSSGKLVHKETTDRTKDENR